MAKPIKYCKVKIIIKKNLKKKGKKIKNNRGVYLILQSLYNYH